LVAGAEFHAGHLEETLAVVAGQPSVVDRAIEPVELPNAGRSHEARPIAEATVSALRDRGNPFLYAFGLAGYGRAFIDADPQRAVAAFREAVDYSRRHRLSVWEHGAAYSAAVLVAEQGEPDVALVLLDDALEAYYRAGADAYWALALAHLAVLFCHFNQAEVAATLYGASAYAIRSIEMVRSLPRALKQLQTTLGQATFDERVAAGAAMQRSAAAAYARAQIRLAHETAQKD
jgi:hypothetical protein